MRLVLLPEKILIGILLVAAVGLTLKSQTAPPNLQQLDQAAQQQAKSALTFADQVHQAYVASTQPVSPLGDLPPKSPVYTPIFSYYVSTSGDDAAQGTKTAPFKTVQHGIDAAKNMRNDGTQGQIGVLIDGGGKPSLDPNQLTYVCTVGISTDTLLVSSYNGIPKLTSPGGQNAVFYAIGLNGVVHDLRFQNIDFVASLPTDQAFYFDGVSHVSFDGCYIDKFTFNVIFQNASDMRAWNNVISDASGKPGTESGSGIFVSNHSGVDVEGNYMFRDGWDPAVYTAAWLADIMSANPSAANSQLKTNLQFFHTCYFQTPGGHIVSKYNFYVDAGGGGLLGRCGGISVNDMFQSNGFNQDAILDGDSFELANAVFFGDTGYWPLWGGGIAGQANILNIHDCYFLGQSVHCINPAISLRPTTWGDPTKPYSTTLTNLLGVWQNNGGPQDLTVNAVRTPTLVKTNVNIRTPKAGEKLPSLNTIYGTADDAATALLFVQSFRNGDSKFTTAYVTQQVATYVKTNP